MSTASHLEASVGDNDRVGKSPILFASNLGSSLGDAVPDEMSGSMTSNNGSMGLTSSVKSDSLPEQKIFPGIVHERAHRSSAAPRAVSEDEEQPPR